MRRLKRRFKRPKSPYDVNQIKEGKELLSRYGLRRKKEIWIAQDIVRNFRQRARQLIAEHDEAAEKILLERLAGLGLLPEGSQLDDVLGLTVEALLERRLQTVVHKKGLTKTARQARQSIVHGHVTIGDRLIVHPSYIVPVDQEGDITSTFTPPEPPSGKGQVAEAPQDAEETDEAPGEEPAAEEATEPAAPAEEPAETPAPETEEKKE